MFTARSMSHQAKNFLGQDDCFRMKSPIQHSQPGLAVVASSDLQSCYAGPCCPAALLPCTMPLHAVLDWRRAQLQCLYARKHRNLFCTGVSQLMRMLAEQGRLLAQWSWFGNGITPVMLPIVRLSCWSDNKPEQDMVMTLMTGEN